MNDVTNPQYNHHHHHSHKAPLIIGGLVFALIALAQLYRLVQHVPITIGTYDVPFWVSGVAVVISGLLSIWLLGSSCCRRCCKEGSCTKK